MMGMRRMEVKAKFMKNTNMPEILFHRPLAWLRISRQTLGTEMKNLKRKETVQCGLSDPCFPEKRMTTTPYQYPCHHLWTMIWEPWMYRLMGNRIRFFTPLRCGTIGQRAGCISIKEIWSCTVRTGIKVMD